MKPLQMVFLSLLFIFLLFTQAIGAETPAERFDRVDQNDDGRIDRYERRYNRADRNNDGVVDDQEKAAAAKNFDQVDRNNDGRIDRYERRFNRADRNNDGRIEPAEARRARAVRRAARQ